MQMVPVSSSNLVAVGYNANTQTLRVEFHNGTYDYYNVPESVHSGLMSASSKGSYLHQNIKDVYGYDRL